ncbi:extracellular solute-binding protein [Bacillus sonorensis]|uniref:Maltodextrin-binding protein n=2 Tax=Bacillus sonorensis TaxID=119858 RepID=M5P7N6_9BACI|nr:MULTISPECIES: extracellular solute-binding protein [Bacillus]TWK74690.1 Maltodextrin-binding protein MdxE [Bacillus paralicheniformis]ASB87410.1 Maltodextrin-binding protein MdxE [Bacillus sonorensis]EME75443.1 maltodextrin ABC transporter substrate-binding protein MdxE [Bacillus sonorensis L12]MCZ0074939.1 extracellular solute-binding protein [Bacillus sonorensis]MCZ0094047.1 extracellular solute-binding protein [Bacillus sonorensis]
MAHVKKGFALLLAAVLTFGLAACSGSKDTAGSGGKKVLTVSVEETYKNDVESIKDEFEKENDVTIKIVEKQMFDQLEALPLDGPAGNAPDVMLAAYDRIGGLGKQGHLLEIKPSGTDSFGDKEMQQVTVDGKVYGMPLVIETLVLYYNKDLVKTPPKTFKELEQLTDDPRFAFASEKGKSTAFLAKWTDFYMSYGLLAGYGGYVFGKDGSDSGDIGLNNKGSVEAVEYAMKWFQEHWPKGMQDNSSADDFIQQTFIDGKAAAIIGGPWSAANYKEAGLDYGAAKIPTLPNGKEYAPFAGGKGWVASKYTKEPELAQKWLEYAANDKNAYKFYEDTNEVPANTAARKKAGEQNNELTTAVINQYETATPTPNIPEMAEVWTGAESLIFDAASGKKSPQQSADDAVDVIKENIKEKYAK